MIDRVYIGCCVHDVWLARISVASIRHWHPDVPICLHRDQLAGRFSTKEIEQHWNVKAIDVGPRFTGWGFTKLELLFRRANERYLFVDADTAFVGPLLDTLRSHREQFIVSPDPIDDPRSHPIMSVYFDYKRLKAHDPTYEFPGFVFNAGQFVATSGVFTPEDFWAVAWEQPPSLKRRDLFFSADQGFFNYLLALKASAGEISCGTATLHYNGKSDACARLRFDPSSQVNSFLIHWPGEKPPTIDGLARHDVLRFFENAYYARIPLGELKRSIRALVRRAFHHRRQAAIELYQELPAGLRSMLKRLRA